MRKPTSDWTPQEKWVWEQVSQGEIADFNKAEGYEGELDPREPEGWENRVLRPKFLETILLQEPYRNDLTHRGVRIVGAWFKEPVDLSDATIPSQLWLNGSRFEQDVDLSFLKLPSPLSLVGSVFVSPLILAGAKIEMINMSSSTFKRALIMNGLEVGNSLFMRDKAQFAEVDLRGAKIEGQLNMSKSTFSSTLNMDSLEVKSSLFMKDKAQFADVFLVAAKIWGQLDMSGSTFKRALIMNGLEVKSSLLMIDKAQFAEVDLRGAKIEGQLNMSKSTFSSTLNMDSLEVKSSLLMRDKAQFAEMDLRSAKIEGQLDMRNSTFSGTLDMNGLEVGRDLVMRDKAQFAEVDLKSAKIGGQLSMNSSTFRGTLDMNGLEVGSSLLMRNIVVEKPIPLDFARIKGSLDISGAELSSLNLTGTKVVQEFRLGPGSHSCVKWTGNSELILSNTEVGNLQDVPESWPKRLKLQLDGFVYQRLGGFSGDDTTDMATREISWLKKEWLGKQKNYSPRPYQQLAKILKNAGYEDKATEILFEGKKRQQKETKTLLNWWCLFLQWLFIGYGYHNFYVLPWVLFLCGLGMLTLHLPGQDVAHGMECWGLCYSLDMLLPIIEFHKPNYDILLEGWVRVYFYVHKIFGYVLASFLIAGLSGLTKR